MAFTTRPGGNHTSALLDDEMLDAFTVVAAPDELAGNISDRYGATIEHP